MKNHYSQLGQNIKTARTLKGIKQTVLAEMVNMDKRTLQNIENGQTETSFARIEAIAKAFGMTVDELQTLHECQVVQINKPKNNQVVYNTGTVQSDDLVKEYLYELKVQIAELKASAVASAVAREAAWEAKELAWKTREAALEAKIARLESRSAA